MSRIEHEARALLLQRLESLTRQAPHVTATDPAASWVDYDGQDTLAEEGRRHELAEVEEALRRIEDGTYGRCLSCGGPLGLQRLRAIPEARYCLACSSPREADEA